MSSLDKYDRTHIRNLQKTIIKNKFKKELRRVFCTVLVIRYFYLVKLKLIRGPEVYTNFMNLIRYLNTLGYNYLSF